MLIQRFLRFWIFVYCLKANLICNGDFQAIPPSQTFQSYSPIYRVGEVYKKTYLNQNSSCWYLKNATEELEIKRIYNPPSNPTTVCDLIGMYDPYHLCQTVVLQVGKIYNLSFTLYSNQNYYGNRTEVTLNDKNIYDIRTKSIYEATQASVLLKADRQNSQICFTFKGTHPLYKGANLDNVQLLLIQPVSYYQQVWISKIIVSEENLTSTVLIQTTYYAPQQVRQVLAEKIKVFIKSSPEIPVKFSLVYKNNTALQIYVYGCIQYLNDIIVEFPDKITHNFTQICFGLHDYNDSYGLTFVSTLVKWTKIIGKTFLCSYFIFSLMGIWNLLLIYNFLLVKGLPSFAFITLTNLSTTFYSGSSIISQVPLFKGLLQKLESIDSNEEIQKLPNAIGEYLWFGSMGFSTDFLLNNAEQIMLLLFLCLKLWMFSIANNFVAKKLQVRKITFRHRLHIFLIEIISSSPQTLIGAGPHLTHLENDCTLAKLSSILSVSIIIFISFIIFWDYLLTKSNKKSSKTHPSTQKYYNDCHISENIHFFLLHFLIPILVVTRFEQFFFVFVTFLVAHRFQKFYVHRKLVKGFLYFKLYALNLGWIVYHSVFLFFWLANKYSFMAAYSESEEYKFFVTFSGNYLIFFIVFAAFVEIVDFIIRLPSKYIKPFFKTCKLLFNVRKSQISPLQKEENKKEPRQLKVSECKATRKQRDLFTMWKGKIKANNGEKPNIVIHEPLKQNIKSNKKLQPPRKKIQVKKTKQIHLKQNGVKQLSMIRHQKSLD